MKLHHAVKTYGEVDVRLSALNGQLFAQSALSLEKDPPPSLRICIKYYSRQSGLMRHSGYGG